jgi:hypothetical protein
LRGRLVGGPGQAEEGQAGEVEAVALGLGTGLRQGLAVQPRAVARPEVGDPGPAVPQPEGAVPAGNVGVVDPLYADVPGYERLAELAGERADAASAP